MGRDGDAEFRLRGDAALSELKESMPRFVPTHYQGHTYPGLFDRPWVQALWKRWACPRDWHLWDECWSSGLNAPDHVLVCDACGVSFGIAPPEYVHDDGRPCWLGK